jgi:hypothetical protein
MKVERVGWGVGGGGPSFRQTFQAEASSVEEMEGEESALHGLTQPRVQPIHICTYNGFKTTTHTLLHTNISVFIVILGNRMNT